MSTTSFCRSLGIDVPIFNAPLGGGAAGPALAAAVSEAGGCGLVGLIAIPPPAIAGMIAEIRALTAKPFGAGVVLVEPDAPAQIETCLEAKLPLLVLFWGDPTPWVRPARAAGTRVAAQVGSVDEARAAAAAGVDFVIAQGVEAGGHVRGTVGLLPLLDEVLGAVDVPVLAAGGIGTARAVAALLAAGADGVRVGTRFLAANEADVHPDYLAALVAAGPSDTLVTEAFSMGWPGAPHRVLRTCVDASDADPSTRSPFPPSRAFQGDVSAAALYAGQSVGAVRRLQPAAAIVRELLGG